MGGRGGALEVALYLETTKDSQHNENKRKAKNRENLRARKMSALRHKNKGGQNHRSFLK